MTAPQSMFLASVFLLGLAASPVVGQDYFVSQDGVRLHYISQGTGLPVVLLHGRGDSVDNWIQAGVVADLSRDHRVLALDLRGHGLSDKPHDSRLYGRAMRLDIVQLLDHLGLAAAHVVGHSLGAQIVAHLMESAPDRFLSATLVAAPLRYEWPDEEERTAQLMADETERDCWSRIRWFGIPQPGAPTPTPEEEAEYQAAREACFADPNVDRFALAALIRSGGDRILNRNATARVRVPTLAIVGSLDPLVPASEELASLRSDVEVVIAEGAGHNGPRGVHRHPDFLPALRRHFASVLLR